MSDAQRERGLAMARAAFADHRWADARAAYLALRAKAPLSASDAEAFAEAAWWEGSIDESLAGFEDAYRLYLQGDKPAPRSAAMLALDIGFSWFLRGEEAIGSGWMSRAHRLLEDEGNCVERGYLDAVDVDQAIAEARYDDAVALAIEIATTAERFGDETLCAFARVGEGIARIRRGDVAEGLRVLDEAMLPVVAGRVRPTYAGNIYCQLMSICVELADLRRAQQWTDTTARWCEGFSSAVMFMGVCRVHRAQLLTVRGEWDLAEAEIAIVREQLAAMNVIAVGLASYELGEVRRMRGDLAGAEAAFAEARDFGCDPLPGLALVMCEQGRHAEALDALRRADHSLTDELARTRLWPAMVEIAIESGELDVAEEACRRLQDAAAKFASSGLLASAAVATGRVQLAAGDHQAARHALTDALQRWQSLGSPLQTAEVHLLLAQTHDALGDARSASEARFAAKNLRRTMGIAADRRVTDRRRADGITAREVEVLELVARGLSNRAVAEALVLSEKTVARHLSNIYTKIGVSSRTAAAAYAHAHGLVPPPST